MFLTVQSLLLLLYMASLTITSDDTFTTAVINFYHFPEKIPTANIQRAALCE